MPPSKPTVFSFVQLFTGEKKTFHYSSQLKGIVGFKVQAKERKGMFRRKRKMKEEKG